MKFHNPKYPYDPKIKLGNLIKHTYGGDRGFWKVTKIEDRVDANPLFTIERMFDNFGRKSSPKVTKQCDAFYCRKVTQATIDEVCTSGAKMFEDMKANLSEYLAKNAK